MADENKPKGQPVKLTVTSCVVGYTGKNARGDDYTIYEIQACRENGEVISDKKLRSFEELPVGEVLDLIVVPFQSEKHGLSFTLSRKNKTGTHQRINELAKTVEGLATRLSTVEALVRSNPAAGALPPPATQSPADHQAELDARFGAAPPF